MNALADAPWRASRVDPRTPAERLRDELMFGRRVVRSLDYENGDADLGRIVIAGRCWQAGYFDVEGDER